MSVIYLVKSKFSDQKSDAEFDNTIFRIDYEKFKCRA